MVDMSDLAKDNPRLRPKGLRRTRLRRERSGGSNTAQPVAPAQPVADAALGGLESVSATEAKNSFGAVLDKVMAHGRIAITKHDEVRAVVLSVQAYEALLSNQHDPLRALQEEFDGLVERMQQPAATDAGRALFDASPAKLGRAAVASCRD
jgi:antitoxin Phd